MRISESHDRLVIADTPGCFWMFGGIFVLSGSFVLLLPLFSGEWSSLRFWEQGAILLIGASHLAGGSWMIAQYPETRTTFDRSTGTGEHRVRKPWSRHVTVTTFALSEVQSIMIAHSKDGDGDPMYQLQLWLTSHRLLLLQGQPAHGEEQAKDKLDRIRTFLATN